MKRQNKRRTPTLRPVSGSTGDSSPSLRVLVADDQLLVRAGICELLKALPNITIVGEAGDGREAIRLIRTLAPDIVVMDIEMPEMNGLEALVVAMKHVPGLKIIMVSEHSNEAFVYRALQAGAAGFVVKDDPVDELYRVIKSVAGGREHLSPQVSKNVMLGFLESSAGAEEPAKHLTPRQREVLLQIAEGRSTKEIATHLHVSVNTVKTHRLKLMEKLGAHEVTSVVRYAAKLGLINN